MQKTKKITIAHIIINSLIFIFLVVTCWDTLWNLNWLVVVWVIFVELSGFLILRFQNKIISISTFLLNISLLIFVILEGNFIRSFLTLLNSYEMPSILPDSFHWENVILGVLIITTVIWNLVFIKKYKKLYMDKNSSLNKV